MKSDFEHFAGKIERNALGELQAFKCSVTRRGQLTVSTVHSAKSYDAYCMLLASTNDFPQDLSGPACFYVGSTRAIEYLEATSFVPQGLALELQETIEKLQLPER